MQSNVAHVPSPARTRRVRPWAGLLAGVLVLVVGTTVVAFYAGAFGERGRFARAPYACSLLRGSLVSAIVPNPKREQVGREECQVVEDDTADTAGGIDDPPDRLSVSEHHFATRAGDNPEIASRFFDDTYADGATRVTGIGDEASVSASSFAVRVSNLIVVFTPMSGLIGRAGTMDKVRPLAEQVARELQSS